MPTEVNKCILGEAALPFFKFCHPYQWGPSLIKGAKSSFDTTLEGFCQLEKKNRSQRKVVPLCENGRKKAAWFTQTTTLIYLNKVIRRILAVRCNINIYGKNIR